MSSGQTFHLEELSKELPTLDPIRSPSAQSMFDNEPFNFMSLPIELRLMVYERIPCQVHHTRVNLPPTDEDPEPTITLVTRTCSTAILLTSRQVYYEAKKFVSKVANDWILQQPLRIISSRDVALEVVDRVIDTLLYPNATKDCMFESKCFVHMISE